jgi:hypothetical protein
MVFNMQHKQAAASMLAVFLLGCSCITSVQARAAQMGELRILAIGDSITQGSVPSKGANHPYTIQLKNILQSKYSGMNIVIENQGMPASVCWPLGILQFGSKGRQVVLHGSKGLSPYSRANMHWEQRWFVCQLNIT